MSLLSIVHEFAVLYSSRVFQKDKKWNDGRLRYYELNNKLEVFSDDMLLVGADFYPHHARNPLECGVFEDGSLYILPNGKLILEFNEYLGTFERDLSNVFVKKDLAVTTEPNTRIQHNQPDKVGIKQVDVSEKFKSQPRELKLEPRTPDFSSRLDARSFKPQVKRPIGLRRRNNPPEKQPTIHRVIKVSVGEKLDASYFSSRKINERIPPGSNKLSKRLKFEAGMILASKENEIIPDGFHEDKGVPVPCFKNNDTLDIPANDLDNELNNDLEDVMNLTQKYGVF